MPTELAERRPVYSGPGGGGDSRSGGGPGPGGAPGSAGGGGGIMGNPDLFGLWVFLGTVSMLFIGFTSAYILRRASADWQPLEAPPVLWLNTLALLASSGSLEIARRRLRGWNLAGTQAFVVLTGVLGLVFVAGQYVGWQQLAARGVFLASNPHSSFFYVLTGVHALHLVGGLVWFAVVLARLRRMAYLPGEDGLRLFATYWHFLGGLWVYLLWLLFVY
jgi:cytochrome c oxidase subunit III